MRKNGFKFLKYKWPTALWITVSVLGATALLTMVFIDSLLAPIIATKIRNGVIKGTDSLYRVNFSRISLHLLSGKAELQDISLTPDTALFHKRQRLGGAPAELYTARLKLLAVSGAHPFQYWFHKELEIGAITLMDPEVAVSVYKKEKTEPGAKKDSTLYQKLSGSLKMIHVGLISLGHIHMNYRDLAGAEPASYNLKEMSLRATGLLIDSATQRDTLRTLYCNDITAEIRNFNGRAADGTYVYQLESAIFSTRTNRLKLAGIKLQPLSPAAFFAKTKEDRFGLKLDSAVLDHFNFRTFRIDHYIEVRKLTVSDGSLDVYSNPHGPLKKTDRVATFPNYVLRRVKTRLDIDTLDIRKMNVSYTEFNKTAKKAGTVTFTQTSARFLNITNQKQKLIWNNSCEAKLSTLFMGRGKLDLSFTFSLDDTNDDYSYRGHLAAMPLEAVNGAVMPLALIKITSGQLNSLDFSIHSTQKMSTGLLKLLYRDVDVRLLRSGQHEKHHSKPVKSLLTNTLIIKHNNPDKGSTRPRFAKVVYIRPKNHPFFQSIWETLFSGIKPCAGIGYAVKKDENSSLDKKERKAEKKALKKAEKNKKKADKQYQKQLKKQKASG